ncbi:MAG: hypothetical protein ACJ74J_23480 [Blastocatellia bacterium]
METKLCPTCGTVGDPANRFCFNCGRDLLADAPAVASTAEPSAPGLSAPGLSAPESSASLPPAPAMDAAAFAPIRQPEPATAAQASPEPTRSAEPSAADPPSAAPVCFQHPTVAATQKCAACGVALCSTCDFVVSAPRQEHNMLQIGIDRHFCPNCINAHRAGAGARAAARQAMPLGAGIMCSRHAEVDAVRRCNVCHTPMCQTCDFELPGYFHVCPGCATAPQREMSPGRKRNLILSYILAAWSTVALALLFAGALAGLAESKAEQEFIGFIFSFLIFIPSIAGTALSVSARDRKLANPPSVWAAMIWNSVILAILIILIIIGNLT